LSFDNVWYSTDLAPERFQQGTVFQFNSDHILVESDKMPEGYYVLLNPECDLAHSKNDFFNFIRCGKMEYAVSQVLSGLSLSKDIFDGDEALSKKQLVNAKKKIIEQINGQTNPRWFFMNSNNGSVSLPVMVLDFQQIFSLSTDHTSQIIENRMLKLNSPFKEQIVTRFYAYSTRIGAMDEFKDNLSLEILKSLGIKFEALSEEEPIIQS